MPYPSRALLLLALMAPLAACGSHYAPRPPPRLSPEICLAQLDQFHVRYVKESPPEGPCPVYDSVRVSSAGAALSRPALMSCDLAIKLEKFTREVVAPQAQARFHQGVREIIHFGAFSCRGRPGGEWSEHAKGDAIDIAGFKLADGTVISVKQDWSPAGPKRDFLRDVARGACGLFSMVLTPKTNSEHANHLHLDIGAYRKCDA
ncbi:MAG TPA: extensin family protein [Stellaceae bacterium]|nr:extensin family protein [Stellaceae bacterium]